MPSWEGKSKTTPLGYRIFVGILKIFGLRPAYWLLYFVAAYYVIFSRKTTTVLYQFYHNRLGYGRWKTYRYIYRNYYRFGQTLIDKVAVQSGILNPFTYDFEGEHYLRGMVAEGKGGLLISAHIGNWEIAGHLLKRLNTTINVVMYDGEHEQIKAYLEQVTGGRNMNIILIREDLSHIYAISEALQNNQLVCMHADRFMEGNKTLQAVMLGESAALPAGPFILASRFQVPVSFVFAFKETARHYHLYATEPLPLQQMDKKEKMDRLLKDFVKEMENRVLQYPEQWFNYFDFWKQ
ncbi:lipid A biosynthesis acyltransferase [Flavihumibacter solisilvae]|uniref:Lipid A biosynthesis acyltransferase n=1 Tax=Flavihumibacter solisilvae TaxID=1349421 RepID=A0A0C1IXG7_9BACT|nr:lipid A biosynthesis acyltransferase [Flavihumibacter solisilvae]KIC95144.1 lipid A biosynthesis acyltransferase [Flavihumibacter solisilvae]